MENLNRKVSSNWYRWGRDYTQWGTKMPHKSATRRVVNSNFPKLHESVKVRVDGFVYNSDTHELFRVDPSTLRLLNSCDGKHSISWIKKQFGDRVQQIVKAGLIN